MADNMYEVQKLLLSEDTPGLYKWAIIETMMEQFMDLARAARNGNKDVVEQLVEGVPDMWRYATMADWMEEADSYAVYPEEFPGL